MNGQLIFRYTIDGDDFTRAGEASSSVKNKLKMLGLSADVTRRVAIAMYEGEINMVIHADGGEITVTVSDSEITMVLADTGPGIPDVEKAMQEGYSTAREEVRSLLRNGHVNSGNRHDPLFVLLDFRLLFSILRPPQF